MTVGCLPTSWFLSENEQQWVWRRSGLHCSGNHVFLKGVGEVGFFLRTEAPISTHGPIISLSLFQTLMIWYCLSSLYIGHTDLHFCNNLIKWGWKLCGYLRKEGSWQREQQVKGPEADMGLTFLLFLLLYWEHSKRGGVTDNRIREEGQTTEGGQQCQMLKNQTLKGFRFYSMWWQPSELVKQKSDTIWLLF